MSELGAAAAHPDYPMWSSLLRWSLAQGSDGTSASPQGPMSEEKRRFLEGALKAMGEDGAERQRAIFEAVQKFVDGTGDADACVDALEQLEDEAQDLDAARDLLKVGMLGLVLKAVDADDAAVSAAACGVVAVATANDAEVQNGAGQAAVDALLGAWRRSAAAEDDGWGRARAARALRDDAQRAHGEAYVEKDACDVLKYALLRSATKDGARLAAKAAFALQALLADDPGRKTHLGSAINAATRHLEAPPLFADDVAADAARAAPAPRAPRARRRPRRAAQARGAVRRRGEAVPGRRGARGGVRGRGRRALWRCSRGAVVVARCFCCRRFMRAVFYYRRPCLWCVWCVLLPHSPRLETPASRSGGPGSPVWLIGLVGI